MTEAILIEIAQRRRRLEALIEQTKPHVGAARKRAESELKSLQRETQDQDTLSRWQAPELSRLKKLQDACEDLVVDLDTALDACRDDMNRMQDLIREMKGR